MRELVITKVEGGYIARFISNDVQSIRVFTDFDAVKNSATGFFGEDVVLVPKS